MSEDNHNPLSLLQQVKMSETDEKRVLTNLRTIMQQEELIASSVSRQTRHRHWNTIKNSSAAAAALMLVAGVLWAAGSGHGFELNRKASNASNASSVNNNISHKQPLNPVVLHHFSESTDWVNPDSSQYTAEFTSVEKPSVPTAFEQSVRPSAKGVTAQIEISRGTGTLTAATSWQQPIEFTGNSLEINGKSYTVPVQYRQHALFVLPVDKGIVWAPAGMVPADMAHPTKDLAGSSPIFYTPYQPDGGSLNQDAHTIASLPHSWQGIDGPVLASAWTGWLPTDRVAMPKILTETVYNAAIDANNQVTSATALTTPPADWPTLFIKNVTKSSYYKSAHYAAYISDLTRTYGGFVLNVGLMDATKSGRNAGLYRVSYYWSENTNRWTPLTQSYVVRTIGGGLTTGSDGVYWNQPLPVSGSGNHLLLADMYFDPATLSVESVTAQSLEVGGWFLGSGFAEGDSWIVAFENNMSKNGSPTKWSVFTPNPLFNTRLTLPTGQTIGSNDSVRWKDLDISLQIQSLPGPGGNYASVIGNHSTILSHEQVSTSAGPAILVLNERTPPAAAQSTTPTYEYWVITYGTQYTYAIEATVVGNRGKAKAEVMQLLNGWKVPR